MDSEKLLTVIDTILTKETTNVEPHLANLVSQLGLNTTESLESAEQARQELFGVLQASPINGLAPSLLKMLDKIGGSDYAGTGAQAAVTGILDSGALNAHSSLDTYLTAYRAFIARITLLSNTFREMKVEAYEAKEYEIGFIVPVELNDMIALGEKMKMWDRFIVICAQIAGEREPTAKVTRVNNGSVELFVAKSLSVAMIVEAALRRIATLYQEFQKIQKTQVEIEGLQLDNEIKQATLKNLRSGELELEKRCLEEAATEVFDKLYKKSATGAGKDELKTQFSVALKVIARDIQQGVEIEVSAPTAGEPDDKTADQLNKSIASSNRTLKQIYSEPLEKRLLPFQVKLKASELRGLEKHKSSGPSGTSSKTAGSAPAPS